MVRVLSKRIKWILGILSVLVCIAALQEWWATHKSVRPTPRIGAVQISFLNDGPALSDTLNLLQTNGVAPYSLALFQKAVAVYNATPPILDLKKFPKPRNDIYSFESVYRLVAALPHKLCDTEHSYEMNCFDTMFILLNDSFQPTMHIDEISAPFLVPHNTINGGFEISQAVTPRKAFCLAFSDWYREVTDKFFPKAMADARACFTACLFRYHEMPVATSETNLSNEVLGILRSFWKKQNLKFPAGMEVVLCHDVAFPQHTFVTVHAALLLRAQNRYIYIEKAGGKGPYVRFDLENKTDLLRWLAKTFTGPESKRLGFTHHFVTFNDKSIEALKEEEKTVP